LVVEACEAGLPGLAVNPCGLGSGNGSDLPRAELRVSFSPLPVPQRDGYVWVKPIESQVLLILADDNEKPTLKSTSQPPKGTKVSPRERIIVRMEASEEYGDGRTGWQSGSRRFNCATKV
jgi:hypothetical protein